MSAESQFVYELQKANFCFLADKITHGEVNSRVVTK